MDSPSFHLPACPLCSSITTIERPFWKLARHTKVATGKERYQLMGCGHARGLLTNPEKFYEEPEDIANVEAAWAHQTDLMFQSRTFNWTPAAVLRFRRELDGKHFIPGTTERLEGI